jgi:hypothetical protein
MSLRDKIIAEYEERIGKIPKRYVPKSLTIPELKSQLKSIEDKTDRPAVSSAKPRRSKWTQKAHEYFDGKTSVPEMAEQLSRGDATRKKQLITGFKRIIKKGEGAYYSSGSRPGVSATQWGIARLYAVLFGSKPARAVDKDIIEEFNIPLLL